MAINQTIDDELKKKVFYGSAIDTLADPYRTSRWRMLISTEIFHAFGMGLQNHDQFDIQDGESYFAYYIQTPPSIPAVSLDSKSFYYMGFKKWYPTGQTGLDGDFTIGGVCTEDMAPYEAMMEWRNLIYNTGELTLANRSDANWQTNRIAQDSSNHIHLGLGQQANWTNPTVQLLRNQTVTLEYYDWMYGNCIFSITYINAWPTKVELPTTGGYESASLGTWKASFKYDRFTIWIPPGYKYV